MRVVNSEEIEFDQTKMVGLGLTTPFSANPVLLSYFTSFPTTRRTSTLSLARNPKLQVLASKDDDPKFDHYDQMELKFGQLLGEDPKLTLAKIMARKSNPDASFLEVEKSFFKKKGNSEDNSVEDEGESLDSFNGLNLVRPVPKKGVKFTTDKPIGSEIKKPKKLVVENPKRRSIVPNVILRKPTVFNEDDDNDKSSRLRMKPNLMLEMGKVQMKEKFSDITLLKKPQGRVSEKDSDQENVSDSIELENSKMVGVFEQNGAMEDTLLMGLQPGDKFNVGLNAKEMGLSELSEADFSASSVGFSMDVALQGKPKRLNQSEKEASNSRRMEAVGVKQPESNLEPLAIGNFDGTSTSKESEDIDWARAEDLIKSGGREEVEVISSSTRGFLVSFGSLIGFLPYRNLATRWKFLAFESWLRQKGLDPSKYKQNLGIIGSYKVENRNSSDINPDIDVLKSDGKISPDMKLEDLLRIYDQEKIKFLSSFVGQRIKVNVIMADRKSRRLMFSIRPKAKEEMIEKKRSLLAKLSVGDVVKCTIKKITYFGIFVEIDGVPGLIHQTEVSWDATLDPTSCFKIGQVVDAKVHRLDFGLERIFLSLKEISPDPLIETLESVVGDNNSDGRLEAAQADTEWADVESLIKELEQIEGVQSVSKGRFLLSPGLAPTFQVYMASMFENQYKLLARSGNKVQEVIVQASLDKEEMKSAILACTNRVE